MEDERPREKSLHDIVRFVGVSTLLTPVITLCISMVIARALGTEGRGAYGIVVTTVSILPRFIGLGLDFAVRYWSAREEHDPDSVLKTTTLIGLAMGVFGAVLIGICGWLQSPDWLIPEGLSPLGVALFAAVIFGTTLCGLWSNYLTGLERYGYSTFGKNLAMVLQVAALGSFWLFSSVSLDVALGALTLQVAVLFALFFALHGGPLVRSVRARVLPGTELRRMIDYGWWQYLASMLMQTNMRLNVFILVAIQGLHETGLYTAVLGPAALLWMLAAPLISVISVRTTRRSNDPEFAARVAGALRLTLLISSIGGVGAALIAPLAIPMLFGDSFADAVLVFQILIPGTILFSLTRVIVQFMAGANRPRWNTGIAAVGAVMTVLMSVVLIPFFGANGAAAATSIAYLAATAVALYAFLQVSALPLRDLVAFRASDWSPIARVIGLNPSGSAP